MPFADGGPTTLENLELRCPAHNAYEAERWFGPVFVRETGGTWGELASLALAASAARGSRFKVHGSRFALASLAVRRSASRAP